jgi:hypothetical protein
MRDLATKYGKDKSFNDADLFNDIEKFTYPEVGQFLRTHVGGKTPLPMEQILKRIGIDFVKENAVNEFSLGNPDLGFNPETQRLVVEGTSGLDDFGKALKYKKGDELNKLNGKELKIETIKEVIAEYYRTIKEGDKISVEVYRPKSRKGKYKVKTLTAVAKRVKIVRRNQINLSKEVSEKQKETLKAWIGMGV